MNYTWEEFDRDCEALAKRIGKHYDGIYGIKRGGWVVAVKLSHLTGMKVLDKPIMNCIIVDDIADKGNTLQKYLGYDMATLFYKKTSRITPLYYAHETTDWIVFPWETKESSKADYERI
jgi:hypoxanthine phosphoribosyltransferase